MTYLSFMIAGIRMREWSRKRGHARRHPRPGGFVRQNELSNHGDQRFGGSFLLFLGLKTCTRPSIRPWVSSRCSRKPALPSSDRAVRRLR